MDGGFSCPNADGTVAVGGCVYCDNRSFSPARRMIRTSILQQIEAGIRGLEKRHTLAPQAYLAYFQPATNTYASIDRLRQLYDEATRHPKVVGLVIATRPDCVANDVLDLIESYTAELFVGLELGLQSIHPRSLEWMNRGHDVECYHDAIRRTRGRKMDVSAHVILGLPGESRADMLATADALARSEIDGVKIHNLHVVRRTPMESEYSLGKIPIMDHDEYLDLVIAFLERLSPSMVVHRVTADAPAQYLVAPKWVLQKAKFLQDLKREMEDRDTWQGRKGGCHGQAESAELARAESSGNTGK